MIRCLPPRRKAHHVLLAALLLAAAPSSAALKPGETIRVSVGDGGVEADGDSLSADVSGNGRIVTFSSNATNLVAGDTNGLRDVFVHTWKTGQTERVSVAAGGVEPDGPSLFRVAISGNGRFVAYASFATNLVAGDTNGQSDCFVFDRLTGATERVSVGPGGTEGDGRSFPPSGLSRSGRFVSFSSDASNLVAGDTNAQEDVFVHDRQTGVTERLSVATDGTEGNGTSSNPSISGSGRYVVFQSDSSNLTAGDTNETDDIFLHDRKRGTTTRVTVGPGGVEGDGTSFDASISANGRFMVFSSAATNLVAAARGRRRSAIGVEVFLYERTTGLIERASVGVDGAVPDGSSRSPRLSRNGRVVVFHSAATNLVAEDFNGGEDIFVYDRETGTTTLISFAGEKSNGRSTVPAISANGKFVAFTSDASNLVAGDTNAEKDIFLHRRARREVRGGRRSR